MENQATDFTGWDAQMAGGPMKTWWWLLVTRKIQIQATEIPLQNHSNGANERHQSSRIWTPEHNGCCQWHNHLWTQKFYFQVFTQEKRKHVTKNSCPQKFIVALQVIAQTKQTKCPSRGERQTQGHIYPMEDCATQQRKGPRVSYTQWRGNPTHEQRKKMQKTTCHTIPLSSSTGKTDPQWKIWEQRPSGEGAQGWCFWRDKNILIGLQMTGVKIHISGCWRSVHFTEYTSDLNKKREILIWNLTLYIKKHITLMSTP